MTISEKCAYIGGLAEGLKLDCEKAEGRLIVELLDTISLMAEEIEELRAECETLRDYAEELDEDLGDVEEAILEMDEDDDCDCDCDDYDFDDCDGDCTMCDGCDSIEDLEAIDENMRCYMCPGCGDTICYDEDMDPANIVCPSCGKPLLESDAEASKIDE